MSTKSRKPAARVFVIYGNAGGVRLLLVPALLFFALLFFAPCNAARAVAQSGGHMLFGDLQVEEGGVAVPKALSLTVILYTEAGISVGRQNVPNNGRYRFMDLPNGIYYLAVEFEGSEAARVRVEVQSPFKNDFRQDIQMEWRGAPAVVKAGNVSAADFYKRAPASQKLYDRAGEAMSAKKYADASALLLQIVGADAQDYQAWTELGTALYAQDKYNEAETAYRRSIEVKPAFAQTYLNLARLRMKQKNYDGAIEILNKAVVLQPPSADANFLLGEAYLQIKKGSKAVPHLEEAARFGRADAHLRLATLYNAVGMKDRAAAEYEQFLSKKPDHPDRRKLEQYIKENKKK